MYVFAAAHDAHHHLASNPFSNSMQSHLSPPSPYHGVSHESSHEEQYPMLPSDEILNKYPLSFTRPRRRYLYLGCVGLAITSTLAYLALSTSRTTSSELIVHRPGIVATSASKDDLLNPSLYLNGPPTRGFRGTISPDSETFCVEIVPDNLRPDAKYLTSWISAGWSAYFVSPPKTARD